DVPDAFGVRAVAMRSYVQHFAVTGAAEASVEREAIARVDSRARQRCAVSIRLRPVRVERNRQIDRAAHGCLWLPVGWDKALRSPTIFFSRFARGGTAQSLVPPYKNAPGSTPSQ